MAAPANRSGKSQCTRDENGLTIAVAEGFASVEPFKKALRQIIEENFRVALQRVGKYVFRWACGAVELHSITQERETVRG